MHFLDPGNPVELAREAGSLFRRTYGEEADVVARASGRVNLIGEHTDYNAGLCLPLALPHSTYAAVGARADQRVRVVSSLAPTVFDGEAASASGWAAYAAGVVWALREEGVPVPGLDLAIVSTIPLGAGLSSSAALSCSVARGIGALVGPLDTDLLVRAAIRAENDLVGAPTGGMDQTIALRARPGQALLLDFRDGTHEPVGWSAPDLALLVIDTGVRHDLADGAYAERRALCHEAATALHAPSLREVAEDDLAGVTGAPAWLPLARHVVTENERVEEFVRAVAGGDFAEAGALMTSSHESLRDDFRVSCPELDVAVAAALATGALGARMTGGGFGGSAIALLPTHRLPRVVAAVNAAYSARAWPAPRFLRA
jgi:galactokinase